MMIVEEIKNRNITDNSEHFTMTSDKGGTVEFSISGNDNSMHAYEWHVPGEGRIFLKELERYASDKRLKLIVTNVINPKLETILRSEEYNEYYIEVSDLDGDIIQCWSRK